MNQARSVFFIFITLGGVFVGFSAAWSQELVPYYRGVRDEAMGGAGVAVVNDETALFINPAGLGKIRGPYLSLINPEVETNYETVSALGASASSLSGAQDPQTLLNFSMRNPDKNLHAKVQATPAFVTTNFGLGGLAKYSMDAIYSPTTATMQYNYLNDYAIAMGYCFRLFQGRIKIGLMGKVVNRVYISQSIPSTATGLTISNLAKEGSGAGWDAGIILTAPWAWLPTISAVAHDIGNTYFTLGNGVVYSTSSRPPPQTQKIDAALAVFPYDGKYTRASITAQYNDVQNPSTTSVVRRLHAGMEINFADVLFLRAGYNEGYYTAGLELSIAHQQIQLATYGEEIGTYPRNQEDRRFVARYTFRF